MRTSKAENIIRQDPQIRLRWAILNKLNDHIIETRAGKLWREHIVKKGVDKYTVYDPGTGKIIKRGVA
ncbi:MAG TPA: hypothetical protein PLH15_10635 [Spirochaetota bacterium]|nr:hypothetical protein [Spirochaetota bacterium]HQQ24284.1 hypothetical protein [Spirochaetota bacterium]